nr:hypothetical protein [Tanacetum cinerariifolium]
MKTTLTVKWFICFCRTEVFELSLERYGVTDVKAAGSVTLFVDSNGVKQV